MENIEWKEAHKKIIFDICIIINNCANCYNEGIRQTECNPFCCVETYELSEKSFCIDSYNEKTNRLLTDTAKQHGYKVNFIMEENEIVGIKFCRQ